MKKTNQLSSIQDQNWDDKIIAILWTSYVLFSLWEIRRSWNGAVNLSPDGATVFALTFDFSRLFQEPSWHNVRLPTRRALQTIRQLRWMMNQGGIMSSHIALSTNHSASVHTRTHVGGLEKPRLTIYSYNLKPREREVEWKLIQFWKYIQGTGWHIRTATNSRWLKFEMFYHPARVGGCQNCWNSANGRFLP